MKKGMIKVSVFYPNGEGKHFNMDYYVKSHIPLVEKLLGSVEPGSTAPFAGMGNMYFDTVEDFGNAFGTYADQIMGDLPNFTNIEPAIQISEVMI